MDSALGSSLALAYPRLVERLPLEPEQEQLFSSLVEAVRNVPRDQREEFMYIRAMQKDLVQGNGFSAELLGSDIHHLINVGLLSITNYHSKGGGFNFFIPPDALEYYEWMKREAGEPVQQVETLIREYLDSDRFTDAFPEAYERWRDAVELLWGADSDRELSTIGHKCREAIQQFATALVDRHQPPNVNPDKAMTRDRLSAVLNVHRADLGEKRSALLDSLFGYWRAAADLIQRQEHAGQREGESLDWEDGRRVVFQTAVIMFEVDRTLSRTNLRSPTES